jgi:hypothetical protein
VKPRGGPPPELLAFVLAAEAEALENRKAEIRRRTAALSEAYDAAPLFFAAPDCDYYFSQEDLVSATFSSAPGGLRPVARSRGDVIVWSTGPPPGAPPPPDRERPSVASRRLRREARDRRDQ